MQGRLIGRPLTAATAATRNQRPRLLVTRASNRAAVHGTKLPERDALNKDEAEKEIKENREEKEKKGEEIEKAVDSKISTSSDAPFPPVK